MNRLRRAEFHAWAAFCVLAVLSLPVPAAQRVALVIGNAEYRHTTPLRNPRNDAADVARALKASASRPSKASTPTRARSSRCSANSRRRRAAPR